MKTLIAPALSLMMIYVAPIGAIAYGQSPHSKSIAKPAQVDPRWLISKSSLGLLNGSNAIHEGQIKAVFPGAIVTIEEYLLPGGTARGKSESHHGHVVVKLDSELLFTMWCNCRYDPHKQKWLTDDGRKAAMVAGLVPSTTNPKFKTENGIGVGNTLGELSKAYKAAFKTHELYFIVDHTWGTEKQGKYMESRVACFADKKVKKAKNAASPPDSPLSSLGFRVESMAASKRYEALVPNLFDRKARIVEVHTGYRCNDRAHHHD